MIHERGSPETLRDPRGFAIKFYTREGNFDMVGNNIPVSRTRGRGPRGALCGRAWGRARSVSFMMHETVIIFRRIIMHEVHVRLM